MGRSSSIARGIDGHGLHGSLPRDGPRTGIVGLSGFGPGTPDALELSPLAAGRHSLPQSPLGNGDFWEATVRGNAVRPLGITRPATCRGSYLSLPNSTVLPISREHTLQPTSNQK